MSRNYRLEIATLFHDEIIIALTDILTYLD